MISKSQVNKKNIQVAGCSSSTLMVLKVFSENFFNNAESLSYFLLKSWLSIARIVTTSRIETVFEKLANVDLISFHVTKIVTCRQ